MLEWMLILAAAVNRLVEFIKRAAAERFAFTEDALSWLALGLSILLGIASAFVGNANALALLPENSYTVNIPDIAGIIAAGVLIGLGSNALHAIGEWTGAFGSKPIVESRTLSTSAEPLTVPYVTFAEAERIANRAAERATAAASSVTYSRPTSPPEMG